MKNMWNVSLPQKKKQSDASVEIPVWQEHFLSKVGVGYISYVGARLI